MNEKKGFIREFKEFILKGNVLDLAVGVIIGGAFTAIVNSLADDVIVPFMSMIFGGVDLSDLKYVITPATEGVEEVAICYGQFLQSVVNFLLIALVVFVFIKILNKFKRKKEEEVVPVPPREEVVLLREIRDAIKEK